MRISLALLALSLATPAALAGWSSHGNYEPDYEADVAADLMYAEPDWSPAGRKVYFNAWLSLESTSVNPNVGATQSRIVTPNFQHPLAYLGVWKDCNQDSYIGMAESALSEYRAELLFDNTLCPPGSWFNHDGWIHEFVWIGSEDNTPDPAGMPFVVNDTDARVWGDTGLPGDDLTGGVSCYINPATGQLSTTGGMISFVDCSTGRAVANTINDVDRDGLCVAALATCAPPTNLGLAFENPNDPACSSSRLNVDLNTWNDDPSCPDARPETFARSNWNDRAFTVADCSSSSEVRTGVADADGEEIVVFVPGFAPSTNVNPQGSVYEGLNHTWEGTAEECDGAEPGDNGFLFLDPEAEVASDQSSKREADWTLQFVGYEFNAIGFDLLRGSRTSDLMNETIPRGTPQTGGVGYIPNVLAFNVAPMWYASSSTARFDMIPVREDATFAPPLYYTFYASVGGVTTALASTPGGQGTYGFEWCGSNTSDVILGFDCMPSRWYDPAVGASEEDTEWYTDRPIGVRPGQIYQLRDIDCYDGSIVGSGATSGIGTMATYLNEEEGTCLPGTA